MLNLYLVSSICQRLHKIIQQSIVDVTHETAEMKAEIQQSIEDLKKQTAEMKAEFNQSMEDIRRENQERKKSSLKLFSRLSRQ